MCNLNEFNTNLYSAATESLKNVSDCLVNNVDIGIQQYTMADSEHGDPRFTLHVLSP